MNLDNLLRVSSSVANATLGEETKYDVLRYSEPYSEEGAKKLSSAISMHPITICKKKWIPSPLSPTEAAAPSLPIQMRKFQSE